MIRDCAVFVSSWTPVHSTVCASPADGRSLICKRLLTAVSRIPSQNGGLAIGLLRADGIAIAVTAEFGTFHPKAVVTRFGRNARRTAFLARFGGEWRSGLGLVLHGDLYTVGANWADSNAST